MSKTAQERLYVGGIIVFITVLASIAIIRGDIPVPKNEYVMGLISMFWFLVTVWGSMEFIRGLTGTSCGEVSI